MASGTNGTYAAGIVTLDGSPDLSNCTGKTIYVATSTGPRYFNVSTVNNILKTVTVTPILVGVTTNLVWQMPVRRKFISN